MNAPLTIGSLFSGVGGLELGLEQALDAETIWQVEMDHTARRVLRKHWPDAILHLDVRNVGHSNLKPVDLVCGGFPCQDISAAGKGAGLAGARSGLWYEFHRVVGELAPAWVVVENVASGAHRWIDAVRLDLEVLGYETLPIPLAAVDVGAPHERARIFVVAYSDESAIRQQQQRDARRGNRIRHQGQAFAVGAVGAVGERQASAHADDSRQSCERGHVRERGRRSAKTAGEAWAQGTFEPDFLRVVHGAPDRLDRVSALGNAVVPQCAEVIGHVIAELCR